jgi:hypothetical protein
MVDIGYNPKMQRYKEKYARHYVVRLEILGGISCRAAGKNGPARLLRNGLMDD